MRNIWKTVPNYIYIFHLIIFTVYYVYSVVSQAWHNYLFHIFNNTVMSVMLLSVSLARLAIANDINVNVVVWRKKVILYHFPGIVICIPGC